MKPLVGWGERWQRGLGAFYTVTVQGLIWLQCPLRVDDHAPQTQVMFVCDALLRTGVHPEKLYEYFDGWEFYYAV